MPLHTTHAKASNQVRRGDLAKANEYSAELRYRAYQQRVICGFTTTTAIVDEAYDWSNLGVTAQQAMENASKGLGMLSRTLR